MKIKFTKKFEDIINVENLLEAWKEFVCGKRNKKDVQEFSLKLMDNIFCLHDELLNNTYVHDGYQAFNISDPKPRNIHKAIVKDRLLHRAIYRKLYLFFDKTFISDSYSCRIGKGTHSALNRFRKFGYKVSKNNTKTCWILKCDIKKFFANIDHQVLINIIAMRIEDKDLLWLLQTTINSFSTKPGVGLPLGNLTSQLFVNIYMNEFDQFVKHKLRVKHYIRYADDFVFFSESREWLEQILIFAQDFLANRLKLELHPDKVFIKTLASGVDFLGWVHFSCHRVLRTNTKKRMIKRLKEKPKPESIDSYLGHLSHGNSYELRAWVANEFDLR
ncbi:MAG: reverse transcriptase/maturase family protein [bacterium]|nr:reverse transcriptase/maturase family protein [bacterium]